jgi:hypothetical protein
MHTPKKQLTFSINNDAPSQKSIDQQKDEITACLAVRNTKTTQFILYLWSVFTLSLAVFYYQQGSWTISLSASNSFIVFLSLFSGVHHLCGKRRYAPMYAPFWCITLTVTLMLMSCFSFVQTQPVIIMAIGAWAGFTLFLIVEASQRRYSTKADQLHKQYETLCPIAAHQYCHIELATTANHEINTYWQSIKKQGRPCTKAELSLFIQYSQDQCAHKDSQAKDRLYQQ